MSIVTSSLVYGENDDSHPCVSPKELLSKYSHGMFEEWLSFAKHSSIVEYQYSYVELRAKSKDHTQSVIHQGIRQCQKVQYLQSRPAEYGMACYTSGLEKPVDHQLQMFRQLRIAPLLVFFC